MTFVAVVTPFSLNFTCVETYVKFSDNSFILYHNCIELKIIPTLFMAFRIPPFFFRLNSIRGSTESVSRSKADARSYQATEQSAKLYK